jgi:alkylation response protein AidB-like acyl-CoA dehydrogenase
MSTDLDTISMLRDSAQRYTAEHYDFLQRWAVLDQPAGYSSKAWSDYADFGWMALRLPEQEGGLDADAAAIGAVMETVGSRLLMEPILASIVLGTGLLLKQGSAAQLAHWLPRLADGSVKLAVACGDGCELRDGSLSGASTAVLHGDVADRLIVAARDLDAGGEWTLCLVDPAVAQRRSYRLVDGRGAASLRFEATPAERLQPAQPGISAAEAIAVTMDEAAVALCAEALGVVRCLVASTGAYLKMRKQFGRTIGSNQALQHRMVDMFLLQQEVQSLVQAAQRALQMEGVARTRIVSGAMAYIGTAARRVANEAVQMHGGLGVTDELEVSHYFRRVMVLNALFGNRDAHFERFVQASHSVRQQGEA